MAPGRADVVVVAAGASQRFGSDKLDADVGGRPLLAWTLDRLAASPLVERIVVVTSPERIDRIRTAAWLSPKVAAVVAGGARRQESVGAGIAAIAGLEASVPGQTEDRIVLVHDGARPLVSPALIAAVIDGVRAHGAAVPILPLLETIKRVGPDGGVIETIDRTGLGAAQTPQGATLATFTRALRSVGVGNAREFTDEAGLLEACTIAVHAIPGEPANIKVTLPGDLARVESILTGRPPGAMAGPDVPRIGYGSDSHPFGPGLGLALGGLIVEGAPRLHGHSDGDVLLHAVADALLGAAGLGDLGRIFPAGPATPAGAASSDLLSHVLGRVRSSGFAVATIDCTVVAARPRLATRLPAIGGRIAELLGIEPSAVNVKASTGNLAGMEGAGRGISATAVAVLTAAGGER